MILAPGPDDKFKLGYHKINLNDQDGLEIICMAMGIWPKPTFKISIE